MPKINIERIHHILIYECMSSYNGTPEFQPGDCYKNKIKNEYCHAISFGYNKLISI